MTFKIRGGKFWRLFFWWDYSFPMYMMSNHWTVYTFFAFRLRKIRYKIVMKGCHVYEKDRFKFWQKPKDTGALFV